MYKKLTSSIQLRKRVACLQSQPDDDYMVYNEEKIIDIPTNQNKLNIEFI